MPSGGKPLPDPMTHLCDRMTHSELFPKYIVLNLSLFTVYHQSVVIHTTVHNSHTEVCAVHENLKYIYIYIYIRF